MCNDVNLWTTIFLLLHEDALYGVTFCLCHRLSPISFGSNIHSVHIWTRSERFRVRGHTCGYKHVSQGTLCPNQRELGNVDFRPCSIIANTTSLRRRPTYFAIVGSIECIALAFGPLVSGTIAHYLTWRVSFYIIIPVSVAIIITVFMSVEDIRQSQNAHISSKGVLGRIDVAGFVINLPMTLCLVLGLQWAGTVYSWADWRIILLLTISGGLLLIFLAVEYKAGDNSMVPLKMLCQRSVAFSSLITFCNFAHLSVIAYYVSRGRFNFQYEVQR